MQNQATANSQRYKGSKWKATPYLLIVQLILKFANTHFRRDLMQKFRTINNLIVRRKLSERLLTTNGFWTMNWHPSNCLGKQNPTLPHYQPCAPTEQYPLTTQN